MSRLLPFKIVLIAGLITASAHAQSADSAAVVASARAVVDTLASAPYAGRGYGPDEGALRAARWAARRLDALSLVPPDTAGFLRPFAFRADLARAAGLATDITATADGGVQGRPLALGADVLPVPGTRAGRGVAETVDVGHGLVIPARGINAYADLNVRGRVAVITAPVPESITRDAGIPPVTRSDAYRMEVAAALGAAAVVFLSDDPPSYGASGYAAKLPAFAVRREAWPSAAGRVAFQVEAVQDSAMQGVNVVGVVRGAVRPDSFVIVMAHLDGLGRIDGRLGSAGARFPGANDNASGVAVALALAEAAARHPLRYSLIVVLTGGEELGLHGSTALAAAAPWPLDRTRLVLNLDMAASGASLAAFGGADHPADFARLAALAAAQGAGSVAPRGQRPNSDQWPFAQRGVAALYLLTAGGAQPYHSPHDRPATLEWDRWDAVRRLAEAFLREVTGG